MTSPLQRLAERLIQPGPVAASCWASVATISSSFARKGTTCGFTCETIKWFTLNISANRVIGRSLSTEPSIQVASGFGSQGTSWPVFGSLAKSEAFLYTSGTEQDVHLSGISTRTKRSLVATYTADQIMTFGAVM